MTSNKEGSYCKLNPDTIESVRKEYNLDKPGAMDQAIITLSDWLQKQEHFIKKDLPREYLERCIITAKGSVEKAKSRLDKLYTMQNLMPNLFEKFDAINDFPNVRNFFVNVLMPNLCEDNSRIHVGKLMSKNITPSACLETYQHCRILLEYGRLHDYAKGYHIIYDLNNVNISDLISNVNWIDLKNALTIIFDAYGYKLVSVYMISSSKAISALVKILKQIVSEKIGNRINVLSDVETLHRFLPTKMLPKDFGGAQRSILELYDELNEALASEQHIAHMKEMRHARTNEELRRSDSFNNEYLGMPGSFKMLSVD